MKLFVVGKTGQLARALAECNGHSGLNIVAFGRPDVDVTSPETVANVIQREAPDVVVNAAAYTAVDQAESEPEKAYAINATGAGHVADVCSRLKCPLIHISTDYVFDGEKTEPYLENDRALPQSAYGNSKAAGEELVASVCRRHVILRTSWVYSPFGKNFVKTILRLAAQQSDLKVVEDQVGNPTYAPHLAEAICAIAERIVSDPNTVTWGIYHATGSGDASWYDVAHAVLATARELNGATAAVHPIPTSDFPTPAKRPTNSRLSCDKLAQNFGVRLPDWKRGVHECVTRLVTEKKPSRERDQSGSKI